jgi:hypothetical protein
MKFFRPLRNDQKLFATVHPVDYGTAVAWGDDEEIDLSAGAILRLAEETMHADDMRAFIAARRLTETSLAAIIGYSRRQIVGFLNEGRPIPRVVSLACRYIELASYSAKSQALQPASQPQLSHAQAFSAAWGNTSGSTATTFNVSSTDASLHRFNLTSCISLQAGVTMTARAERGATLHLDGATLRLGSSFTVIEEKRITSPAQFNIQRYDVPSPGGALVVPGSALTLHVRPRTSRTQAIC